MISCVVLRVARTFGVSQKAEIDDLVQEIYLKLFAGERKPLRGFRPSGPDSVYAFIKAVTANAARDHFRSSLSLRRGGGQPSVSLDEQLPPSPAADAGPAEMDRRILLRETEEILNRLYPGDEDERNRSVFWLYYRQGLTVKAIGALPGMGLTESGIESVIYRLTNAVRSAMVRPSTGQKWFSTGRSL